MTGIRASNTGLKDEDDDYSYQQLVGDVERLAQTAVSTATDVANVDARLVDVEAQLPIDTSGFLAAANNLSDVTNAATARLNLGILIGRYFAAGYGFSAGSYTNALVNFGATSEIDPDSVFSGGIYTAPVTGTVYVSALFNYTTALDATGRQGDVRLRKNGVNFNFQAFTDYPYSIANHAVTINSTGLVSVTAGDTLSFTLNDAGGGVINAWGASNMTVFYVS